MPKTFKLLLLLVTVVTCEPDWSYDFVEVNIDNKTPDIVAFDLEITRPARGVFGLGGVMDVKQELTDETIFSTDVYYSRFGTDFIRTPYHIPEIPLPKVLNTFYKEFVMESFLNCTDSAPRVGDEYVKSLTKRTIHLHDCILSNEDMPPRLRHGYYKIVNLHKNQIKATVEILIKVFSKW